MTTLSSLIGIIGNDKIKFQTLDASISGFNNPRSGGSRITFDTESPCGVGPGMTPRTESMGLILWLDREEVARINALPRGDELGAHVDELRTLRAALQDCIKAGASIPLLSVSQMQDHLDSLDVFFEDE